MQVKQAEADEALVHIQSSMMKAADRSKEVEILKKKTAVEEVSVEGAIGTVGVQAWQRPTNRGQR